MGVGTIGTSAADRSAHVLLSFSHHSPTTGRLVSSSNGACFCPQQLGNTGKDQFGLKMRRTAGGYSHAALHIQVRADLDPSGASALQRRSSDGEIPLCLLAAAFVAGPQCSASPAWTVDHHDNMVCLRINSVINSEGDRTSTSPSSARLLTTICLLAHNTQPLLSLARPQRE
ncbi:hypothetical protein DFH06DRAFT_324104 [Mycena polygramma]|nr:hypothetical protein DFH06DRAFT_324104 [Mycena polygramma]